MLEETDLPMSDLVLCCADMIKAQQTGTDGEGYGRLFIFRHGQLDAGEHPTPLRFCPWCGQSVKQEATNV
jgi:hypothetical protein